MTTPGGMPLAGSAGDLAGRGWGASPSLGAPAPSPAGDGGQAARDPAAWQAPRSPGEAGAGSSPSSPSLPGGSRGRVVAVLALVALGVLHLWPVAGPGRLPENLDLMLQYVPNAAHLARGLAEGTIPLWNPWQGGGLPFAANPGTGAWYPPAWALLGTLPLWDAVRAAIWLHLALGVAGTWRCLRGPLGATLPGAVAGTAAFSLSPWLPGLAGMPVVLTSLAWLPWVVDAGLRLVAAPRLAPRTVAVLALATAAQVASGWPFGAYLSWLVLGAATLLRARAFAPPAPKGERAGEGAGAPSDAFRVGVLGPSLRLPSRETMRAFGVLAIAGALGTAVAAVVLIPAVELVALATYADTRPIDRIATDGYLTLLSWLRPAAGAGALEGGQVTVGVAALVLAATSPVILRLDPAGRLALRTWGTIAAVAIVLSWGSRTPLFGLLYAWLPGFRILYLPARLGIVAAFAIACLAAAVVDALAGPRHLAPQARRGPPPPAPPPLRRERGDVAPAPPPPSGRGERDPLADPARRAVIAIAAGLPIVALAQFWHSEGYDDFRRLLTNLWRVTGGPFLTVAQELHAGAFGAATVALVVAALRARPTNRHACATAIAATVVADLGTLAVMSAGPSFDPAGWYAPAFAAAREVRAEVGHDRFVGVPWHAGDQDPSRVRHFLGGFPASARPGTLPPNLGLLAGVRDAQAYDPLILRATARAFADGGAPDDHWAWLARFDPAATRPLAIRAVLAAPSAAWRVPARPLGAAVARCCDQVAAWDGRGAPVAWDRLHLVGFLGEATAVAQGTTVAEATLETGTGNVVIPLRAGLEIAEWAYDRPDVRGRVAHDRAPVSLVTRVTGAVGGRYDTYEYRTTVPNPDGSTLAAVAIRATVPGVTVHLAQVAIDLPGSPWQPSPLGWRDPSPEAARLRLDPPDAGRVDWLADEADRLRIGASLSRPARVVVADTPYPGWHATVDGVPVPIGEAPGVLARIVEVPAGDHVIDLAFDSPSVAIGRAVSLAGLAVAAALVAAGRRR